jgi:predicted RNA binding protein YcfA (HicA-like mRNA interferase family)
MSKLPILDARAMERVLLHLGFVRTRQRGSHVFYRHPDGRTTTVPWHSGRDLARPLIRAILQDIDMSPEDFRRVLDEI